MLLEKFDQLNERFEKFCETSYRHFEEVQNGMEQIKQKLSDLEGKVEYVVEHVKNTQNPPVVTSLKVAEKPKILHVSHIT